MRLAQLDRASGYGPEGRGFESSNARIFQEGGNTRLRVFPFFDFQSGIVKKGGILYNIKNTDKKGELLYGEAGQAAAADSLL